jgi:OTU-like cysteine protease
MKFPRAATVYLLCARLDVSENSAHAVKLNKMSITALNHGFLVHDVPADGDCGLHAVIDQLRRQCSEPGAVYDVSGLRNKAVEKLVSSEVDLTGFLVKKEYRSFQEYLKKQRSRGTWCDELMIRILSEVVRRPIYILHDNGYVTDIQLQKDHQTLLCEREPLYLGLIPEYHYVSLIREGVAQTQTVETDTTCSGQREDSPSPTNVEIERKTPAFQSTEKNSTDNVNSLELPNFLKMKSWVKWRETRDWLGLKDRKVVCNLCTISHRKGLGTAVSERSRSDEAFVRGVSAKTPKALLKKIDEHKNTSSHKASVLVNEKLQKELLPTAALKAKSLWEESKKIELQSTAKIFNIAYACAKYEMPFSSHPKIVKLMERNGNCESTMLFSEKSCASIIQHIANEMKSELITFLKKSTRPFSVLVDESTTLSLKSTLIIYIRTHFKDDQVSNYFFDLVELSGGATGEIIASAIYNSLLPIGESRLKEGLIGFASDGASAMRGEYSGAAVKLQTMIGRDLISFHCMAHRLELAVNSAVKSAGEITRLQSLTGSLYAFYHRSPKNTYELQKVAASLTCELMKITQIFTVRWVCSTLRAVTAFVTDYRALLTHLKNCSEETRRATSERATCRGFAKKIQSWSFVAELLLLADALEVLWHLSAYLQTRTSTVIDAELKIRTAIKSLEAMKSDCGVQLKQFLSSDGVFQNVKLSRSDKDAEVY